MRYSPHDAGLDESEPSDLHAKGRRPRKTKRGVARLRVGPGAATLGSDKKDGEELFESTVVVTSCPPPPDETELRMPTNIQLHEEVFVHYPPSALNSPASMAEDRHTRNASLEQTAAPGENAQHGALVQQSCGACHSKNKNGLCFKGPILHEQDHDCCPFTAIRRSETTLRAVSKVRHTSPLNWPDWLSSFSIKNAFMFYPPPPTYGFFRDEDGTIQVRSQTGKRAPRLDHERIEYLRRKRRLSKRVPDDLVGGALHGIAFANQQEHGDNDGSEDDDSELSFKLIFIPWENEVQSYYIRSGSIVFGRRVHMGYPLFTFAWLCPIPCSIIRPHRRMSSHVAIFFHCNGEDIGRPSCLRLLTLANALHMTILVPEYPGYGLFEGHPSEASVKGSMERVVEFLFVSDPSLTPSRLILIGHSIGTGVAIHVAQFISKTFLKVHDSIDVSHQLPYACPMSSRQHNSSEYAAPVRSPSSSFAVSFSAVPATSPTAQIPMLRPPNANVQPMFTPPSAAPPQNSVSADSGDNDHRAADVAQDPGAGGQRRGSTSQNAPYCRCDEGRRRSGSAAASPFLCPHYALGGIILLAPFASLRCVERWKMLADHGFDVRELERRRLTVQEDVLVPAPEEWVDDARELRNTGADPPDMEFLRPPPFLFDLARYISFNRFPTIDIVRDLQEEVGYFTHTPLLLLHGAQDVLIPAINSVAIATALRQATGGRTAKVYLGFLHDEGHNNLHCSHIIRRFYKDVILLPHLHTQQELREGLERALRSSLGWDSNHNPNNPNHTAASNSTIQPAVVESMDSTSVPNNTASPSPFPPMFSRTAAKNGEEHSADEPHAFEAPLQRDPPRCSLTAGTYHITEPFDEEQPEVQTTESAKEQPCNGEVGTTDAAPVAVNPKVPNSRQPAEPYLYFIEPAYAKRGAVWLGNGTFASPIRIRLLHPPPQRNSLTEFSPHAEDVHRHSPLDANIFVTLPVDARRSHPRNRHDDKRQCSGFCNLAVQEEEPSAPSRKQHAEHPHHHNNMSCETQVCHVSEQFEESLRYTLHRTQPPNVNFAPAATMLHIALFHNLDHYDVGSIAVASVTKHSIDATVALRQWRCYRRNHFILRCLIAFLYFSFGAFFISLAICHGVLTHPSKLRPYLPAGTSTKPYHVDARVVVWGVLDGVAYLLLGIVRFFHARLGLGNLSKYMDTSTSVLVMYTTCRLTAYTLCVAVGILMAMIIALTPPHRGGVDWDRWSDVPYSRRAWISYLPRWTMVTSACINLCFLIAVFVKNH